MASTTATTVELPAIIDLDALDPIRDGLIEALEHGAVAVGGANVERVSTNALLLLLSAAETARRNDFSFNIAGASSPMLAAIDRLGLASSFAPLLKD